MYNHQLDAFIKTAELGSFSKAAEAMYISSPALIQQINLLDGRCGFSLFVRAHHGVTLTPAGCSLYEDAKTSIQFSKNALEKAGRLAETSQNTVRVGTSLLYKCRVIPDLWSRIGETHPDWKLELDKLSTVDHYPQRQLRFFIDMDMDLQIDNELVAEASGSSPE